MSSRACPLCCHAQCCDPAAAGAAVGCRRYLGSDDDAGCVGGVPPRPHTFAQATALCVGLGLGLCDSECAGTGCGYNDYPARA